jgi:hypothetical protein
VTGGIAYAAGSLSFDWLAVDRPIDGDGEVFLTSHASWIAVARSRAAWSGSNGSTDGGEAASNSEWRDGIAR